MLRSFKEFSATVSFDKTRHSVAITEWLIENKLETFRELSDWLAGLLPQQ